MPTHSLRVAMECKRKVPTTARKPEQPMKRTAIGTNSSSDGAERKHQQTTSDSDTGNTQETRTTAHRAKAATRKTAATNAHEAQQIYAAKTHHNTNGPGAQAHRE